MKITLLIPGSPATALLSDGMRERPSATLISMPHHAPSRYANFERTEATGKAKSRSGQQMLFTFPSE